MNPKREELMEEVLARAWLVTGMSLVLRNPKEEPDVNNFPCAQIFELEDTVEDSTKRGKLFVYKRKLNFVIESFILATTEGAASSELTSFIGLLKKEIYREGPDLGGRQCLIWETGSSQVLRPPVDVNAIGIALNFNMRYVEVVENLYN